MKNEKNYIEALLIDLGKRIRDLRERKGYSQETLGFKAGLHRNYISKLELAQKNPTYTTLIKLSIALEVNIEDLIKR
ncbi:MULTISPECIES: helix-turn-helix domain-containing protein [Bacillus]|uniref:helix-turn-helix domain-containing protein n=1 Tax=Bacillus TaxID=1386 RepID=UPI000C81C617|nr:MULTISPECIES: helix-turn-helix transcriptional regulator [Bacillus]MCA1213016.1 helix-turn-helix domain-containing protein [Bacillus amyloliquefaciens]MCC8301560.1 helix-turn-helix domain-containing protein [Bacillus sp. AF12]MCR4364986.1 helix-turn-helix domain-containing protein [Bacillus amyloliquefaciens]MCV3198566.1 helix-turn-helix domain-containing protein [Bacillus velezensis]MCY0090510.1 helix-turn-helix domain-containing protein [Bacillus velezensis]